MIRVALTALLAVLFTLSGKARDTQHPSNASIAAFLDAMPRVEEIYRRKVNSVVAETGQAQEALARSPTLLAIGGLVAMRRGDVAAARQAADRLLADGLTREGGLFFPFRFTYSASWPFHLEAPWASALTQGLALALFDSLARADIPVYADAARATAASFAVPIENGGFSRTERDTVFFEEYPIAVPTRVLNGGLIATLALADYLAREPNEKLQIVLAAADRWWIENAARYTVVAPQWPRPVSAYSLAPTRRELLFRFVGLTAAEIDGITLDPAGAPPIRLAVGAPGDDRMSAEAFVWFNPRYQDWRPPETLRGRTFRRIAPGQGIYSHAPFTFSLPAATEVQRLELTVTGRAEGPQALGVEMFDGTAYRGIGVLHPSAKVMSQSFEIPENLHMALLGPRNGHLPVEPSYFADNAILLGILARRLGDAALVELSKLWLKAADLSPVWTDARPIPGFLVAEPDPVLRIAPDTRESRMVEYPSLMRTSDGLMMVYTAIGGDRRRRLFLGTSADDGRTWTRQGQIFSDEAVPFGSAAFPSVIQDPTSGTYRLYFSADTNGDGRYDAIFLAETANFTSWQLRGPVVQEGGLDASVWIEKDRYEMAYTIVEGQRGYFLVQQSSGDGIVWSAPRSILAGLGTEQSGFHASATFLLDDVRLFVVDHQLTPGRRELHLYCRTSNATLEPAMERPLHVTDTAETRWDQHRYGLAVLPDKSASLVFYNGIRLEEGDGTSMIGRAKLSFDEGLRHDILARCRS